MWFFLVLFWLLVCCPASAQEAPPSDPLELSEAVMQLELKLGAQSIPERDAAERQLIAWGLPVLDHLSAVTGGQSAELQQRLTRIRSALEKEAVVAVTNPGVVRLSGELTLAEVLEQILKQSGNRVVVDVPLEKLSAVSVWRGEPLEFWEVVWRLQREFNLVLDPYAAGPQILSLSERPDISSGQETEVLQANSGVLSLELTRIDATRNLRNPELSRMSYTLLIHWEPRLRPISIDIPQSSLRVVDEYDKVWQDKEGTGIFYGMVQPEIPELEFTLVQPLVDRQVESIKSFSGIAEAVLPGRIESFEFKNVGATLPDTSLTKGAATVTYDGLLKLESLFGARLALSFSEENNALESHQSWAYQNECFLELADGRRIESIGSETYQQENARLGVMFLFPEYPPEAKLVYRTPAAIVKVKIPFELKGIKLP